jgi:predicted nucleic acid-binding protein
MEILGFNFTNPTEEQSFINFVNAVEVIPISQDIVNQTITFRKMKKIKLPDAIIGSTAFVYKYDMITRNMSDFKGLGITCINPFNDLQSRSHRLRPSFQSQIFPHFQATEYAQWV